MGALAAIVSLLRPQTIGTKIVRGADRLGVRYPAFRQPSFALVLDGPFDTPPTVTLLGGYFTFDPINAPRLLDYRPKMLHVRATDPVITNVAPVVGLIKREAANPRAGQTLVLTRLIEILLVEALRSASRQTHRNRISRRPLRCATRHRAARHPRANRASLDARHARAHRRHVPIVLRRALRPRRRHDRATLLLQWRLGVAKDPQARGQKSVVETALAVGYESASGFSTALSREIGRSPTEFIATHRNAA